ncbi:MAG: FAD:protein FMN transferase [Cytophagaceae bacterium]|nr:FAD:protein FMN transferase [Cytophagaceae bacterium]
MLFSIHKFSLKILLIVGLFAHPIAAQTPRKFIVQRPMMGSIATVQIYTTDSLAATRAAAKAFAAADSLNLIFSDYLENSELSRLNCTAGSGRWVPVSPALFDILNQSKLAWQVSEGAFDVTVGRLTRLWRQSRKTRRLPAPDTLRKMLATVGGQYLHLAQNPLRAKLDRPGALLDLGGIGKGYAAQVMLEVLQKAGFPQALADASGNMAIGTSPGEGWRIAVQIPTTGFQLADRQLLLQNTTIDTSGDLFQFVEIGGKRYSHILNPKTGLGQTSRRQVTVLSANAAHADWLATACCLLPIKKALALVKQQKAEVLILEPTGGKSARQRIQVWMTPGFEQHFVDE